ncbi:hypothetical protein Efla_002193 [Eimeria flavescens]
MMPEDGGMLEVFSADLQQGKKKTGMRLQQFRKNAGRQRPSVLFALLLVNTAIAFLVVHCYRARGLSQQRRLAEVPYAAAGGCSKQGEEEESSNAHSSLPSPNGSPGSRAPLLVEELSALLLARLQLRRKASPVAKLMAYSATEKLPLDAAVYERQLALLQLSDELKATLHERERKLIEQAEKLVKECLASRRRRSARWRAAFERERGGGAAAGSLPVADSELVKLSRGPERTIMSEEGARVDLVRVWHILKGLEPDFEQGSRPLLLAARFRLLKRDVSSKAIEALALAECVSKIYLTPRGVSNRQEVVVIDEMALEALEKSRAAEKELAKWLQHTRDDPHAFTREMLRDLKLALQRADKVHKEVSIFTRRLRLLYRAPPTPNRVPLLESAAFSLFRKAEAARSVLQKAGGRYEPSRTRTAEFRSIPAAAFRGTPPAAPRRRQTPDPGRWLGAADWLSRLCFGGNCR